MGVGCGTGICAGELPGAGMCVLVGVDIGPVAEPGPPACCCCCCAYASNAYPAGTGPHADAADAAAATSSSSSPKSSTILASMADVSKSDSSARSASVPAPLCSASDPLLPARRASSDSRSSLRDAADGAAWTAADDGAGRPSECSE